MDLNEYILRHIDPEDEYLHALWRATQLQLSYGHMVSSHLQGRLLKMLVSMIRPRRVLELGTFSGYSALCMAEGLPPGGELHTVEIFDEQEDFIRHWLQGSPHGHKVTLHIGDALEVVPRLEGVWDMAFIDADKRLYPEYYRMLKPRMRKGGFMVVDNTLWYGHVTDPHPRELDLQTRGVQTFNEMLARDREVEKVILPLRDGLTLVRIKE